ncbi:MAG: HNH endonuclease [Myxococcales bacterium]|nr:HNH endonuclease [Myxococcales bacterium]MCB9536825.1 HNH endonuclease [Myxococcales bacterium]
MSSQNRHRVLWCAATDRTFRRVTPPRGGACLVGKCIHCRSRLTVELDGSSGAEVTLEHIVPRTHGGTDDLDNLALACARCNAQKGYRLDHRRLDDPTLQQVIATLRDRRAERWRDPPPDWALPPRPT